MAPGQEEWKGWREAGPGKGGPLGSVRRTGDEAELGTCEQGVAASPGAAS